MLHCFVGIMGELVDDIVFRDSITCLLAVPCG